MLYTSTNDKVEVYAEKEYKNIIWTLDDRTINSRFDGNKAIIIYNNANGINISKYYFQNYCYTNLIVTIPKDLKIEKDIIDVIFKEFNPPKYGIKISDYKYLLN